MQTKNLQKVQGFVLNWARIDSYAIEKAFQKVKFCNFQIESDIVMTRLTMWLSAFYSLCHG